MTKEKYISFFEHHVQISVDPQSFDSEFMDLVIETTQGEEEAESTKQIESSKRQKR